MKRSFIYFIIFLFFNLKLNAQSIDTVLYTQYLEAYNKCYSVIKNNGSFRESVSIVENIYSYNPNFEELYQKYLGDFLLILAQNLSTCYESNYKRSDILSYFTQLSIFKTICDTNVLKKDGKQYYHLPLIYNFADPQGNKDWKSTFVVNLLTTYTGNCRSLTYLYKMLADDLGAKCWLALAPNHIYIRNYCKQTGWYNTELTSGTFPTDAWIAATGYVSTDAIRSGVYMDTLSNQQSIGLCILDLAQGYLKQTNNYTDGFVLKCCNLVLQYHAVNPEALLIKAEVLKRTYLNEKDVNNINAQKTYNEMEQTYITLVKLGYREMPYKTYLKWLKSVKEDKEKYLNKKINATNKK